MKISEIQRQALDLRKRQGWTGANSAERFQYLISEVGELARELQGYSSVSTEQGKATVDRAVAYEIYDIVWNL